MTDPAPFPPISARETHISRLWFAPDRVYKFLKPVATSFVDFRSTGDRLAAVAAELELNRRIAPDVYLGTGDMYEHGVLVDRCLILRRLPDERKLSALAGAAGFDDAVREVARCVAAFHAGLTPIREPVPLATPDGLRRFWMSSFDDLAPAAGDVVGGDEYDAVRALALDFLDRHDALFERRRRDGWVVDGHGDLLADDIFVLDDGPRILDCLAFDRDLRAGDVLADVAFLAMDLEHVAGAAAADALVRWYGEFSGETHPPSLLHHYIAYRAHVRAKVAVLRLRQGDRRSAELARQHHHQALAHLQSAVPVLVLVGGAPGTGKTTLARALAESLGWCTLDSDTLRKDLHRVDRSDHAVDEHPDLYSEAATALTYRTLRAHAEVLLEAGNSVILDATWPDEEQRRLARVAAGETGALLVEIECVLADEIARQRLEQRARTDDASDATPAIAARLGAARHPWPSATRVDTATDRAAMQAQAEAVIRSVTGRALRCGPGE